VVARGRAERQAREQDKRLRRLRRRIEQVDEAIVLAEGASQARRHLRGQGYERSDGLGRIEHAAALGRVLSVR
jgi:hypothetical protein